VVLEPAVLAVDVGNGCGERRWNKAELCHECEQGDVADIARQRRMAGTVQQHQELHGELDVDHAARIVLEIEKRALVRMARVHPAAHFDDVVAQAERLARLALPELLSGKAIAAWCVAEPGRPVTPDGMALRARRDGDGFVLDGVKRPVEAGGEADWLLVTATGPDGLSQFLVPSSAPGLRITPLRGLDLVRRHAEIRFEDVRVPASAVVGVLGSASLSFERQIQTALVLQCAEMVGATDRVFDFTVQYAFDRSSFGRALASYQALKHRFADMKLWIESAQAITVDATRSIQTGAPDAAEVVRIAKAYVAERCPELIQDCVQMHGGIGVTWEHNLHLYLRRVVLHRQTYGDPIQHRDQVAILAGR